MGSEQYFALIRNFRRQAFLLLYLFGASPAVCSSFVQGRESGGSTHGLQALNASTLYLPYATSLRMGRLGYQSDAQSALAVSYNGLGGYWDSLYGALTTPYPAYQAIGVQAADGSYQQLADTLLQIENEFYGTIRPKRVIDPGERPLHALRERGVEYVEVRLMELDPFEPVGINAQTMRFLDVFLLHCLLHESPLDTPEEIAAVARNQHLTAQRGREPGLQLERVHGGVQGLVGLREWGLEMVAQFAPIAQQLDSVYGGGDYARAVEHALQGLQTPATLPSARVLRAMNEQHGGSFMAFARAQSASARTAALTTPLSADKQADFERMARESIAAQVQHEQADAAQGAVGFADFLRQYLSPQGL